ncbi:MAG: adenylosuccinate synthase [Thermodesulfobacteriota bacterium]|nr:adenylosuccinate synthase [Thermodesulfobacteriota bacterium]
MANVVVVGTQWGDEGKGKIVDLLTESASVVVRFQGGNNAGHTLVVGEEKFIVHLVPSGILHPKKRCFIGNGLVVDPDILIGEIEGLRARGIKISPKNLALSEKAHLIMPYHKALDLAREAKKGKKMIGTTGRGIGPCYEDKAARVGLRAVDLLDRKTFLVKIRAALEEKNFLLENLYGVKPVSRAKIAQAAFGWAEYLGPFITNVVELLDRAAGKGQNILFEGAQGTHLDVDHGTYPFVTSSNPVAGTVCAGAGFAPTRINSVIGLVKAYTTRVGGGPFPTELKDKMGLHLRKRGAEYGSTTGRPRRCGWLDTVVLRESARLNGLNYMAVTKLDVLSGLDEIKVCVAYELDGKRIKHIPADLAAFQRCRPVYETYPGWKEDISKVRAMDDLPRAARKYLKRLTALTGVSLSMVSVGPDRQETMFLTDPFEGILKKYPSPKP